MILYSFFGWTNSHSLYTIRNYGLITKFNKNNNHNPHFRNNWIYRDNNTPFYLYPLPTCLIPTQVYPLLLTFLYQPFKIYHNHPHLRHHQRSILPTNCILPHNPKLINPNLQYLSHTHDHILLFRIPTQQQLPSRHPRMEMYIYLFIIAFLIYHSKHYMIANCFSLGEHVITKYILQF